MPRAKKQINIEIGARIQEKREALLLTRDQFSEKVHYSTNFIHEVELGRSGLSSESMKAFAEALDTSVDSLLLGETKGFENIVRKLRQVPPKKIDLVEKIINDIVDCSK